jgi:hypothetical protein
MPVIFGRSIGAWLIQIVGAVLVFLLVKWLLPMLMAAIGFPIPEQIVTVLALLLALVVLFGPLWWSRAP